MMGQTVSRPSLKVTRHDDRAPPDDIEFEVWNPLAGIYEQVGSIRGGMQRMEELADRIHDMWVRKDPRVAGLHDVPAADPQDDGEWAEFRVSAQANRVYETRRFDKTDWVKAPGKPQAAEITCNEVGYVPEFGVAA